MPSPTTNKKGVYSMFLGREHREKLQRMQGACIANGIQISSGCILRTLLEHVPEHSADFTAKVRVQAEKEKAEKLERFQAVTKGRKRGSRKASG